MCERNRLRRHKDDAMRVPCDASEIHYKMTRECEIRELIMGDLWGSLDDRRACVWGSLDDRRACVLLLL